MRKIITMSTTFALLTFLFLGATSCNKYEKQPADQIVGDYVGSGTDENGTPFVGQIIRVSKVSKKRVKVESVGHDFISTFEFDVEGFVGSVSSVDDSNNSLAVQLDGETVTIGLTGANEETFGGTKQ